jgi:hypothetical protein
VYNAFNCMVGLPHLYLREVSTECAMHLIVWIASFIPAGSFLHASMECTMLLIVWFTSFIPAGSLNGVCNAFNCMNRLFYTYGKFPSCLNNEVYNAFNCMVPLFYYTCGKFLHASMLECTNVCCSLLLYLREAFFMPQWSVQCFYVCNSPFLPAVRSFSFRVYNALMVWVVHLVV